MKTKRALAIAGSLSLATGWLCQTGGGRPSWRPFARPGTISAFAATDPAGPVPGAARRGGALDSQIESALDIAERKITATLAYVRKNSPDKQQLPRSTEASGGWRLIGAEDPGEWTAGFFPGCLWEIYRARGGHLADARIFTAFLAEARAPTRKARLPTATPEDLDLHIDLGFDVTNTFLNQLELDKAAPDPARERAVLMRAAKDLAGLYNERAKAIVDKGAWRVSGTDTFLPVDYMMNLEPLFWAARSGGSPRFKEIAISHARTVIKNHIRPDGGTWHHVVFNELGRPIRKETWQGYSNSSTWSRGQAWAIYGFTNAHKETGRPEFLKAAEKLADYFIRHLPEDHIPPWDFDDPDPKKLKDSSAAAIAASALLELGQAAREPKLRSRYTGCAEDILASLMAGYVSPEATRLGLLEHGVGDLPHKGEVDVSLIYGDYYFLEALNRYRALRGRK